MDTFNTQLEIYKAASILYKHSSACRHSSKDDQDSPDEMADELGFHPEIWNRAPPQVIKIFAATEISQKSNDPTLTSGFERHVVCMLTLFSSRGGFYVACNALELQAAVVLQNHDVPLNWRFGITPSGKAARYVLRISNTEFVLTMTESEVEDSFFTVLTHVNSDKKKMACVRKDAYDEALTYDDAMTIFNKTELEFRYLMWAGRFNREVPDDFSNFASPQ